MITHTEMVKILESVENEIVENQEGVAKVSALLAVRRVHILMSESINHTLSQMAQDMKKE